MDRLRVAVMLDSEVYEALMKLREEMQQNNKRKVVTLAHVVRHIITEKVQKTAVSEEV